MPNEEIASLRVMVARVEERQIHMDEKLDDHMTFSKNAVGKIAVKLNSHDREITRFKRDRWWIIAVVTIAVGIMTVWFEAKFATTGSASTGVYSE